MSDDAKIIGPGVCDVCGGEADFLQVVEAGAFEATICRACFDKCERPPEVEAAMRRAVVWAIHDYRRNHSLVVKFRGRAGNLVFIRLTLLQLEAVNELRGEPPFLVNLVPQEPAEDGV